MKFCWTKLSNKLAMLACLVAASSAASAQAIKIGWLSSLTGPLSSADGVFLGDVIAGILERSPVDL